MAKDYFQDIIPPAGEPIPPRQFPQSVPGPSETQNSDARDIPIRVADAQEGQDPADPASRGIRSISAPARSRPPRFTGAPVQMDQDTRGSYGGLPQGPSRRSTRLWIWAAASLFVLVGATLLLFVFSSTVITLTPKSRAATLTAATLTAYQVATAADATPGTLSYTVQTFDLEDSDVVASKGTTHVESKASGSIALYNAYSATPVRLVKTTRFESPDGLIFRALSDIVVPGKVGSTPGQVNVTVAADQAGEKYNIGPTAKFTLPGLKSTAAMYSGVYAKSSAAFSGGFAGEQAGAEPGALDSAVALLRTKLETKAREAAVAQAKDGTSVFSGLIGITYESLPNTTEAGDSVRIHQKARVTVPVFPARAFAQALMHAAFADVSDAPVTIKPSEDFYVRAAESEDEAQTGVLNVAVSGGVLFIWDTDTEALSKALAGKDSSVFQNIVNGYTSIQEAHARITPFWRSTFPEDPADINIDVVVPDAGK
ncbi:hypothetical protein A3D71_01345 [Candidatus Kaiserbacteria bacterium RIFCSPHIGHO2_02_FULL_55_20]|uniref:Baseplate protein J-like domain-containing protein n=1 Tax=Candidatus Kaiserbacteria bacterium RIFCSPHIGHO2_02_FULL_55_20 TaxID=1798497 RepID=A0A1F6DXI3_9BACT|nr:MAG: hypothetical protein A2680_03450 [Candidatus Kaiserbacteria bacterium RIFCSPHIGHO2_01_FULL_55_37]OGG66144.1 MAG: hypothetical protein A3D71_01345 [Candidatus Kaiserbacteria bacterium RIFCSPHIGHO2_02_FULL_55_20]